MLHRQLSAAAQLVLLTCLLPSVFAQESPLRSQQPAPHRLKAEPTGLLTDRLSPKEIERWNAIERIVFAEDNERQPLHPTLRWLWQWIDTSGHTIHVEIVRVNRTLTCTAGIFSIERFDPRGERHVAVIKLNLTNIDLAYVGPSTKRTNGFIPFADLNKEERYVEVLGHEMAHAVHILTNSERTRNVMDYVERTNEMLLTPRLGRRPLPIAPDLKRRLSKRDALLKELEAQAEKSEEIVWRELIASKPKREKRTED